MYTLRAVYDQDLSSTSAPRATTLLLDAAHEAGGRPTGTAKAIQSAKAAGHKVLEVTFDDKDAADSFKEELETMKLPFSIREFIRVTVTKSKDD